MSSDNRGRYQRTAPRRFALCGVGEKKGRPRNGNQSLIANRQANTVDPPWMTGAMPELNRSGTNEGVEKQLSTASEHSPSMGSEVGSSMECRRGNDGDGEESSAGGLGDPLNVYPHPVLVRQHIRRRRSRRQWSVEPGPNLALLQPSDVDGTVTPAHDLRARDLSALSARHVGHHRAGALHSGEVRQARSSLDHARPPAHARVLRRAPVASRRGHALVARRTHGVHPLDPNTALRFCARKASLLALIELHHDDVLDSLPNAVDSPIYDTA
jgi:hypothetical protein